MVYNGTGSSLNNSLLSSSFVLSTIDLVFRGVELGSYFGDNDLGELFFYFPLPVIRNPYCGVYLKKEKSSNASVHWEIWNRCLMYIKHSPYFTTWIIVWEKEFIRRYARDCYNPFQWSNIHPNFPGYPKYLPSLTWVSNINKGGNLVSYFCTYI